MPPRTKEMAVMMPFIRGLSGAKPFLITSGTWRDRSTSTSDAFREFLMLVHPDFFMQEPTACRLNERSLQLLQQHVNQPATVAAAGVPSQLEFYIRKPRDTGKLTKTVLLLSASLQPQLERIVGCTTDQKPQKRQRRRVRLPRGVRSSITELARESASEATLDVQMEQRERLMQQLHGAAGVRRVSFRNGWSTATNNKLLKGLLGAVHGRAADSTKQQPQMHAEAHLLVGYRSCGVDDKGRLNLHTSDQLTGWVTAMVDACPVLMDQLAAQEQMLAKRAEDVCAVTGFGAIKRSCDPADFDRFLREVMGSSDRVDSRPMDSSRLRVQPNHSTATVFVSRETDGASGLVLTQTGDVQAAFKTDAATLRSFVISNRHEWRRLRKSRALFERLSGQCVASLGLEAMSKCSSLHYEQACNGLEAMLVQREQLLMLRGCSVQIGRIWMRRYTDGAAGCIVVPWDFDH